MASKDHRDCFSWFYSYATLNVYSCLVQNINMLDSFSGNSLIWEAVRFGASLLDSCLIRWTYRLFSRRLVFARLIYIWADQHFKPAFPHMSAYFTSASYINSPVYTMAPATVLAFPHPLYQTGSGFQIINFQVLFGTSCIQISIHWKFSFLLE